VVQIALVIKYSYNLQENMAAAERMLESSTTVSSLAGQQICLDSSTAEYIPLFYQV
jgi:hypothetical protein